MRVTAVLLSSYQNVPNFIPVVVAADKEDAEQWTVHWGRIVARGCPKSNIRFGKVLSE